MRNQLSFYPGRPFLWLINLYCDTSLGNLLQLLSLISSQCYYYLSLASGHYCSSYDIWTLWTIPSFHLYCCLAGIYRLRLCCSGLFPDYINLPLLAIPEMPHNPCAIFPLLLVSHPIILFKQDNISGVGSCKAMRHIDNTMFLSESEAFYKSVPRQGSFKKNRAELRASGEKTQRKVTKCTTKPNQFKRLIICKTEFQIRWIEGC